MIIKSIYLRLFAILLSTSLALSGCAGFEIHESSSYYDSPSGCEEEAPEDQKGCVIAYVVMAGTVIVVAGSLFAIRRAVKNASRVRRRTQYRDTPKIIAGALPQNAPSAFTKAVCFRPMEPVTDEVQLTEIKSVTQPELHEDEGWKCY